MNILQCEDELTTSLYSEKYYQKLILIILFVNYSSAHYANYPATSLTIRFHFTLALELSNVKKNLNVNTITYK